MNNYEEIETLVKKVEIGKAIRNRQVNKELVDTYWNIGKLIIDAQGGKDKAKYGDALLKKWSNELSLKYGKGYNYTNMKRFRQFFLSFPLCEVANLSWSQIRILLPIKDENKRNYYINMCNKNNFSKRDLEKVIKTNSYERLLNKPDKINIVTPTLTPSITDNLKNPIVLELKLRELRKEDRAQVEFYMNLVDMYKKEPNVSKTMGLIITKEQNKLIANFVKSENLIPLTYKLV